MLVLGLSPGTQASDLGPGAQPCPHPSPGPTSSHLEPQLSPWSRQVLPGGLRRARLAPTVQGRQMGLGRRGGHTGPCWVPPPPGLPRALPQVPAPGMGGHLHFLGQLQQGDVVPVELPDTLVPLGKDVKVFGDHHLLNLELLAQAGAGIPWEQCGRLGRARAPEGAGAWHRGGPFLTHDDPPQGTVLVSVAEAVSGCQDPLVRDEGPPAGLPAHGLQGSRGSSGTLALGASPVHPSPGPAPAPALLPYLDSDMPGCPLLGGGVS